MKPSGDADVSFATTSAVRPSLIGMPDTCDEWEGRVGQPHVMSGKAEWGNRKL